MSKVISFTDKELETLYNLFEVESEKYRNGDSFKSIKEKISTAFRERRMELAKK